MTSSRLYVGNLSFGSTDASLERVFREYGTVAAVEVITNRRTGRPRGFAYVEMSTHEEARAAKEALDQAELDGRVLRIDFARPRRYTVDQLEPARSARVNRVP